jgi:hypothetical protein
MISNVSRAGAALWSIRNCRNPSSRWHVQAVGSLSRLMVSLKGAGPQGCGRKESGCAAAPSGISCDISHPYAEMAAYFECLCEPSRIAVGAGKRASAFARIAAAKIGGSWHRADGPLDCPSGRVSAVYSSIARPGGVTGPVLPDTANFPCNVPHGKLSFPHNPRISICSAWQRCLGVSSASLLFVYGAFLLLPSDLRTSPGRRCQMGNRAHFNGVRQHELEIDVPRPACRTVGASQLDSQRQGC